MADRVHDLDQPIGALIDIAVREFGEVAFEPVTIGGQTLEVLQIRHMQKYLDKLMDRTRTGKKVSLPLWAKVWPSCLILGYTLSRYPFAESCSILEVGAGCALNSMVMASRGYDVTVTDIEPFALLFGRINALKNGLADRIILKEADFTQTTLCQKFDYVIGCEVLYEEASYEPMVDFLDCVLEDSPQAEIILAMDQKRQGRKFFDKACGTFSIMRSAGKYKDNETGEENVISLYRMKRKQA